MSPDITVVIPTFRRPLQLMEAVRSVLAQQGLQIEVIIVDDSPEASAEEAVAGLADSRVSYRKMAQPSMGRPALVRNAGWPEARGRFVHFMDDDDHMAEGAYATLIGALEAKPKIGVAFGRIEPFGDDPHELQLQQAYFQKAASRARMSQRLRSRSLMVANLLFMSSVLVTSACIIRRECLPSLKGYDSDCVLNEDVDFYLRAIRRFGYIYVDQVVMHYRTGEPSLMHDRDGEESLICTYKHIYGKYAAEYGAAELLALKVLARTMLRWV